ncbi:DoxX family membrane protein [[Mycobacterium] nativiensis]|uniref:DoxX family membrane protein n=1 Tax=[Mycobacterium] nativiensis TaxID=2855503 RepID=A0ABU5XSN6_9MYCO|nr:DoxX family membrane protein [Mycolicibacter sp. MYC340]MEB3030979.1 DoxX family membrane protein [Mycolicibacter sp. MYC340]
MSTTSHSSSPALSDRLKDPLFEAFFLLRTLFTVAPILFGLDKFFNLLPHVPGGTGSSHWDKYLAGWINDILPGNGDQAMYLIGVIEIVAGVLVAVAPRIGAWVVAAWLGGIIVDLLTLSGYYDVALRDFGLLVSAVVLARLAQAVHTRQMT